ncbi:MAG: hypothetical protein QM640_05215 [Niabella sp.]
MNRKRAIEPVVKKVSLAEINEDDEQFEYWVNISVKKRLQAVAEWNEKVWRFILKDEYPDKIERIAVKQIKALTDEDDF